MTRSTVKRPSRTSAKTSPATRRKPQAKAGKPATTNGLERLFAAALSARQPGMLETDCAHVLKEGLGADAAVLSLTDEAGCRHFATSDGARTLAAAFATSATLKPAKAHLAEAKRLGWKCCLAVALDGKLGYVTLYFRSAVKTAQKAKLFGAVYRAAVSAALMARRTTAAMAPESQQFSSLAAAIPGVVYQRVVRPDGDIRYTYLSEGARELFGVSPEDVLKDPEVLFSTYTEDYKNSFKARLLEASNTLTKWDVEASVILPDGRRRTTHAIARPERLADGAVLWTGVILDASRAKEAEEKLIEANRLVGLANQAKSAFLAKMSHEMRTPLNGVLGMGDLLLKTELTQRQQRLATTLCDSAKGLLGIINDVLDLSRIESGHFKLDTQEFNLRHCVEDAVELCATAGYRKGLEVNLVIDPDTPIGVKSDPVRIRQILINLIGNAIKFTERGEVVVRLKAASTAGEKATVAFEVTDTGIGIAETAIGRLFEPFAQADASISRRFGGTGLGLSITRHLVELLGGSVTLSSARGVGTTVRFELPFEVTAQSRTQTILNEVSLTGVRVLVVDDRPTNREMLVANMAGMGADIGVAENEDMALDKLAAAERAGRPYQVAIIDRIRPRCSGLHLCRTIRSNPRLAGTGMVVLMSANWNANPADQHGLVDTMFLSKPARRTDLIAAIARLRNPDARFRSQGGNFAPLAAAPQAAPQLKLRVLLVEDNATNIEVAREYLTELACRVTVAVNGIEAITAYDRGQYDVILMDSQMPELDGLSATRRIRETERTRGLPRTPIIAVTANAYDSDRAQALEAGSDDFLSKPFTDLQLRAMLQKWSTPKQALVPAPVQPSTQGTNQPAGEAISTQTSERMDEALHAVLMRSRPAFLGRLIRTFLAAMPEVVATLRAAIEQADGELLRTLAHSLKSSSANVGAKRLSELCRLLDVRLKLGANAEDCSSLTDEIETELGLVEDALERIMARLPISPDEQAIA